jgi:Transglycosylase-like domain
VTPVSRAPLPGWWWRQSLGLRRRMAVATLVSVGVALAFMAFRSFPRSGPSEAEAFVAELRPERVEIWDGIAQCETDGQWDASTGNGYYGGLQLTLQSWEWMGGTGFPHEAAREEQIMRAEMLSAEQGWAAWPECAEELGLQ